MEARATEHIQEAINFETVVVCTRRSETTIEPLFEELAERVDVSRPLSEQPSPYAKALHVPLESLLEVHQAVSHAFAKLSSNDTVLKRGCPGYPERAVDDPYAPRFLYARGEVGLLDSSTVAVIGTRNPSGEAKRNAHQATLALLEAGYSVCSGLALGTDGVAHLACLAAGKPTIAVIGTSLLESYPAQHAALQAKIAETGLVITRFSPAATTQKWFFLLRNRLMSSLSVASLVVEDRDGGGAVHQAEYALEQGRLVVLYHHSVENRAILWPRRLSIRPGVIIVKKSSDIPIVVNKTLAQGVHREEPDTDYGQLSLF